MAFKFGSPTRAQWLSVAVFVLGFGSVIMPLTGWLSGFPGGIGDPEFNNIVLEHVYRWLTGHSVSLWSPTFFYPFPGALSFSDHHFGTVATYVAARLLGLDAAHAYTAWYVLSAPLNYFASCYALRRMGLGAVGSIVGSYVFAFSFVATVQFWHAQLSYRFAIPLAMLAFTRLLQTRQPAQLLWLAGWITLQFYGSIYLGYFLSLLVLVGWVAARSPRICAIGHGNARGLAGVLCKTLLQRPHWPYLAGLFVFGLLLAGLFAPYLYYAHMYHFQRHPSEIRDLLPQPGSYLLQDQSSLWGPLSIRITDISGRGEQQLFFGVAAWLLAAIGLWRGRGMWLRLSAAALFALFVLSLSVHGISIYRLLVNLPLANAIRAVSRVSLVMLLPLAMLAGYGSDWLFDRAGSAPWRRRALLVGLATLLVVEYGSLKIGSFPYALFHQQDQALAQRFQLGAAQNPILFLPYPANAKPDDAPGLELASMHLAQSLNLPTLNGYSGNTPANFFLPQLSPCQQAAWRLSNYANLVHGGNASFQAMFARVRIADQPAPCALPDGPTATTRTSFRGTLSAAQANGLHLQLTALRVGGGQTYATLQLRNDGDQALASLSRTHQPLTLSWQLQAAGVSTIANTLELIADIPAHSSQILEVNLPTPAKAGDYTLLASFSQPGLRWPDGSVQLTARAKQQLLVDASGQPTLAPSAP